MASAPFQRTTPTTAGGSGAPLPAPAPAPPDPSGAGGPGRPAPAPRPPHAPAASTAGAVALAPESARERVNRRWAEILQETRVAQTGGQILFGLLLSIAFTARFQTLSPFEYGLYVVTVVLGASSTAALVAPVALHRCLHGLRRKHEVVEAAGRMMACGILLLALTIACTLLLILDVVLPHPLAPVIVGAVMVWFALCWYLLPLRLRRRTVTRPDGRTAS
ncbi:DUF6328 family protein [Streptomyces sp. NRRL S-87]|uniref:DUF6328 family protein n=1 Tax=Streptomyces sp. NRRL S-87 TaxID=1463920 RepID=UPI001F361226|nr:DUF6328 family protein [Streptomyces sp. NRRL S-87]